ncbi:MAG: lysophospholipase [Candidatus Omnitrophica bacterium]|nr:lysophospholipase [Candidatus Omnitrophota bacterium]
MDPLIHDARSDVQYRKSVPPRTSAVMILIHGLGAHSARWEDFSESMFKAGIACYAIELKGFGETEGVRGHVDSFSTYYGDICALRRIAASENPQCKVFIVGESLGGLIAFHAAAADKSLWDGLICISPAFRSRLELRPFLYVAILIAVFLEPSKTFKLPFNSSMCSRDHEAVKRMEKDHREHRRASARLLAETFFAQTCSRRIALEIKCPSLFLQAGNDRLVDPGYSRKIFGSLSSGDKEYIEYPEMYHALTVDLGKEKVFTDVVGWVKKHLF